MGKLKPCCRKMLEKMACQCQEYACCEDFPTDDLCYWCDDCGGWLLSAAGRVALAEVRNAR